MHIEVLANELVHQIFSSCNSLEDVVNLASTCRRFHTVFASQRLTILPAAIEAQYGPVDDAVQLMTHNDSQPAHVLREKVPLSLALLKQICVVGRVASKWADIYPLKKWKFDYANRRLLRAHEQYRVRRSIYRIWLYSRAFHTPSHPRHRRCMRSAILERAALLHNWSNQDLADLDDTLDIIREVIHSQICPSNGTVLRKFRKRHPTSDHQLLFNIHLNYPPPPSGPGGGGGGKYHPSPTHEPGAEGWGDEIPHYYVVEDMLKLDPGTIMWLKETAPLKSQVLSYVRGLGDWFDNNGETLRETIDYVLAERTGEDAAEEVRDAIAAGEAGITYTAEM